MPLRIFAGLSKAGFRRLRFVNEALLKALPRTALSVRDRLLPCGSWLHWHRNSDSNASPPTNSRLARGGTRRTFPNIGSPPAQARGRWGGVTGNRLTKSRLRNTRDYSQQGPQVNRQITNFPPSCGLSVSSHSGTHTSGRWHQRQGSPIVMRICQRSVEPGV